MHQTITTVKGSNMAAHHSVMEFSQVKPYERQHLVNFSDYLSVKCKIRQTALLFDKMFIKEKTNMRGYRVRNTKVPTPNILIYTATSPCTV